MPTRLIPCSRVWFLVSVCLAGPVAAGEGTRVEVFVLGDEPVLHLSAPGAGTTVQVYRLDAIHRLERDLGEGLPPGDEAAREVARKRIASLTPTQIETLRRGAEGVLRARRYGLEGVPAVVFDGRAVVYGARDLGDALRRYRRWRDGVDR